MIFFTDFLITKEFKLINSSGNADSQIKKSASNQQPVPKHRSSNLNELIIRTFDVVIALLAMIFLLPLMAVVALAVSAQDGGPAVFAQRRVGLRGQSFFCLKFRSMHVDAAKLLGPYLEANPDAMQEWRETQKLRHDPRITPLGHFLRQSSLDELPQLWNVLRGQMSLVGPRPIVDAEIPRYGRSFRYYCAALPGVTGLWQVSGRSDTSYRRRVAMDRLFARKRTPKLYLAILFMTVPAVLMAKGSR